MSRIDFQTFTILKKLRIFSNTLGWSFLRTNWMGYHQGHDCCALVHQNKSTHSYISPFFFIHSARCRNFFSAKKWAHFLCITWRSLSLFQITIKDKNKKPWWWKKGGHLMLLDSRPKYNGTFFVCLCNLYTSLSSDWILWLSNFRHLFRTFRCVHIVQKSSIKSFLSSSSPKMSKLKLESSKFSSSFVILSESRGRASIAAASQVARNSQNHENHLLYLPDCSTLETWRLWWWGNTGRTNNFIMNLLCLG